MQNKNKMYNFFGR